MESSKIMRKAKRLLAVLLVFTMLCGLVVHVSAATVTTVNITGCKGTGATNVYIIPDRTDFTIAEGWSRYEAVSGGIYVNGTLSTSAYFQTTDNGQGHAFYIGSLSATEGTKITIDGTFGTDSDQVKINPVTLEYSATYGWSIVPDIDELNITACTTGSASAVSLVPDNNDYNLKKYGTWKKFSTPLEGAIYVDGVRNTSAYFQTTDNGQGWKIYIGGLSATEGTTVTVDGVWGNSADRVKINPVTVVYSAADGWSVTTEETPAVYEVNIKSITQASNGVIYLYPDSTTFINNPNLAKTNWPYYYAIEGGIYVNNGNTPTLYSTTSYFQGTNSSGWPFYIKNLSSYATDGNRITIDGVWGPNRSARIKINPVTLIYDGTTWKIDPVVTTLDVVEATKGGTTSVYFNVNPTTHTLPDKAGTWDRYSTISGGIYVDGVLTSGAYFQSTDANTNGAFLVTGFTAEEGTHVTIDGTFGTAAAQVKINPVTFVYSAKMGWYMPLTLSDIPINDAVVGNGSQVNGIYSGSLLGKTMEFYVTRNSTKSGQTKIYYGDTTGRAWNAFEIRLNYANGMAVYPHGGTAQGSLGFVDLYNIAGVNFDDTFLLGLKASLKDYDGDGAKDDVVLQVYINKNEIQSDIYILDGTTAVGSGMLIYGESGNTIKVESVSKDDGTGLRLNLDGDESYFDEDDNAHVILKPSFGIVGEPEQDTYSGWDVEVGEATLNPVITKTNKGMLEFVIPAEYVTSEDTVVTVKAGTLQNNNDDSVTVKLGSDYSFYLNQYGMGYWNPIKNCGSNATLSYVSGDANTLKLNTNDSTSVNVGKLYAIDKAAHGVFVNGVKKEGIYLQKTEAGVYTLYMSDGGYTAANEDVLVINGTFKVAEEIVTFNTFVASYNGTSWSALASDGNITVPAISVDVTEGSYPIDTENTEVNGNAVALGSALYKAGTYSVVRNIGTVTLTQSVTLTSDVTTVNRGESKADTVLPGIVGATGSGTYITSLEVTDGGTTVISMSDSADKYTANADVYDAYGFDYVLDLKNDREIKILQLTDTQIAETTRDGNHVQNMNQKVFRYIRETVKQTQPDLILITGDIVYGKFDDDGAMLEALVSCMDSMCIPWAPVYGNHDNESEKGVIWQSELLMDSPYCLFNRRHNIGGNGNYNIGIARNGELDRVIYMMDSNGCGELPEKDKDQLISTWGFTNEQLNWYRNMALRTNTIAGKTIPSFVGYHGDTEEVYLGAVAAGYQPATDSKDITYTIGVESKAQEGDSGIKGARLTRFTYPGFLDVLNEVGGDGTFFGHQHLNSISVTYGGVRWTFGLKTGSYDESPDDMGGTLVTLASDSSNFTVEHIVVSNETHEGDCVYGEDWVYDLTAHWKECACGAQSEYATHTDEDIPASGSMSAGKKCSVCGVILVKPQVQPATNTVVDITKNDSGNNSGFTIYTSINDTLEADGTNWTKKYNKIAGKGGIYLKEKTEENLTTIGIKKIGNAKYYLTISDDGYKSKIADGTILIIDGTFGTETDQVTFNEMKFVYSSETGWSAVATVTEVSITSIRAGSANVIQLVPNNTSNTLPNPNTGWDNFYTCKGSVIVDGIEYTNVKIQTTDRNTQWAFYVTLPVTVSTNSKVTFDCNFGTIDNQVKINRITLVWDGTAWTVDSIYYGDVNGDEVLDSRDIIRMKKYLADNTTMVAIGSADANASGAVEDSDLLKLYEYLLEDVMVKVGEPISYAVASVPYYADDQEIMLGAHQGPRQSGFNDYTYTAVATDNYITKATRTKDVGADT